MGERHDPGLAAADLLTLARTEGARVYILALKLFLEEFGPERTLELADRLDELSVEGADVYGFRAALGLPAKDGDGDMEDWRNFMGTAWSIIADPATDWEWAEFSERRSVLRVHRCPYWTAMPDELRALKVCESGCSGFADVAARRLNPELRCFGYPRSKPKGDAYCDIAVDRVSGDVSGRDDASNSALTS
jgi:hypothetical protein